MTAARHAGGMDDGLAFFGAVTASLSHQINNALTIVAELNGLSEDLLAGASESRPVPAERLAAVTGRIATNLDRATAYIRVLNHFAHAADHPDADIEVTALFDLLGDINRRFFDLKKAALELRVPDGTGSIRGSAFRALHALSSALHAALAAAGDGATVAVTVTPESGVVGVAVTVVEPAAGLALDPGDLARLRRLCVRLGADVETPAGPGALDVRLALPRECRESLELTER